MKAIRLKKKHYTNFHLLLSDCGVVDKKLNSARPDLVYANPRDIVKMRKALQAEAKKYFPYGSQSQRDMSVEMEMLNLSPNECVGVKLGWVIVRDR